MMSKLKNENFDYIVLDAINNLLVYRDKDTVIKFLTDIVSRVEETKTKMIFYAMSIKEHEELIKDCATFMDNIIPIK